MNAPTDRTARLLALFDELIELESLARATRLSIVRAQDPQLAAEVARMLAADSGSGPLDDGMAGIAATVAGAVGQASDMHIAGVEGRHVGPFVLERLLGRGGMGEVWLAQRDDGDFGQQVAIKLLRAGADSAELRRRFAQERRILAGLSHPGIARFIDGGVGDDGAPWYAMEYVEGTTVTTYAARSHLDARERVTLMVAIADAVAYAQTRLVVHRDLKPANVLVDAQGRPRLLDFGIAKLLQGDADGADTQTGMRAMSPAYAAPEQILGEPISTATDVFALGVVFYELLTGSLPHQRSQATLETLADAVRHETAERPSARLRRTTQAQAHALASDSAATLRLARSLAGDLDTIVLTALRREPERRYATAAAFADDLRRWLEGRPVAAQSDTARYRLRKFVTRHRLAVGSASVVLLALICGFGVALWQADVARRAAGRALVEAARAEREAASASESQARTKRVKEFMMETFVQADPLRRGAAPATTVAEAFDAALERADSELADDPKLQIDVLDDFGEVRAGQGRFDEAVDLFDRAIALAEKTYGPQHPALAESLVNRAVIEAYRGRVTDGAPYIGRAVGILEQHVDEAPMELANGLTTQANILGQQSRFEEAAAATGRALAIYRVHAVQGDQSLPIAMFNHATALLNLERYAEGGALVREAIDNIERTIGPQAPNLSPMLATLFQIDYREGRLEDAKAVAERRLAITRATFSGPHPWTADTLNDLGFMQAELGDVDRGLATLQESIDMFEQLRSENIVDPLRMAALFERDRGNHATARALIDRAHAYCVEHRVENFRCDVLRANRAGMMAGASDPAALGEAQAAYDAIMRRGAGKETHLVQALEALALALNAAGQGTQARARQQEALDLALKLFGPAHVETRRVRANLERLGRAGGS